jgi:cation transport ATPase
VLEQIAECRTAIFDKTGTLTYGEPKLTEQLIAPGFAQKEVLTLVASLERYSKHPLARAILAAAKEAGIQLPEATEVSEAPGQGLRGTVSGHQCRSPAAANSSRKALPVPISFRRSPADSSAWWRLTGRYAAALRFRDAPRAESRSFVKPPGAQASLRSA